MPDRIEKRAVQLGWDEVCDIISEEIENISGFVDIADYLRRQKDREGG
ncbi:MAG: hypothetical protein K2O18_00920 [Oscillospiraceae bacterium]|nr:hypothetical protein [Oscillospiraceae bacterium]